MWAILGLMPGVSLTGDLLWKWCAYSWAGNALYFITLWQNVIIGLCGLSGLTLKHLLLTVLRWHHRCCFACFPPSMGIFCDLLKISSSLGPCLSWAFAGPVWSLKSCYPADSNIKWEGHSRAPIRSGLPYGALWLCRNGSYMFKYSCMSSELHWIFLCNIHFEQCLDRCASPSVVFGVSICMNFICVLRAL